MGVYHVFKIVHMVLNRAKHHILQIQYLELLFACPGVPDHTHMNGLNQVIVFIYT